MTIIATEIQKWKRNKIVWCILALTLLFGAFAIERACSIARSSPYMDSFGDLQERHAERTAYHPDHKSAAILFKSRCGDPDVCGTVPDYLSFVRCRRGDRRGLSRLERQNADGCWPFVSGGRASNPHSHAPDSISCHAVKRIYPADWRNAALSGSRSHCPSLPYGNTPAGKRDGDLSPYFRSSRGYGRKPDARQPQLW